MHDNSQQMPLEINPIIAQAKAMQDFSVPLQFPEPFEIGFHHFLGQSTELAQDVQLQFPGHLRQFDRAGRIEDDLEWPHCDFVEALYG